MTHGQEFYGGWLDGQRGIYKLETKSRQGVKRRIELASSDGPQLAPDLLRKTQDYAKGQLLPRCLKPKADLLTCWCPVLDGFLSCRHVPVLTFSLPGAFDK